jgi:oligopeptide transport system substrate-binding protein
MIINRLISFSYVALSLMLVYSCGDITSSKRVAKGDVVLGGTFNFTEEERYQTLLPMSITDIGTAHLATQIHDGLFKFNPRDMSIDYRLVQSYSVDDSKTTYTFVLRDDAYFHDDPCFAGGKGRKVTAHDVLFSFTLLCSNLPENLNFSATFKDKVVGANDFFNGLADEVKGFKVIDDNTFQVDLIQPNNSFLYILSHAVTGIIAEEAYGAYGAKSKVGIGPFVFYTEQSDPAHVILARNTKYYLVDSLGNQLPYLDTLKFHYVNSKNQQLTMFREGELDIIIGLPSEKIKDVVEEQIADFSNVPPKFILGRTPEMITSYFEFNLTRDMFKDVRIRRAFSYAIDREKIVDDVLRGEAYGPGEFGLTPPTFPGYDVNQVKGYSYDREKARELMAEAGYPDGKGFPSVKLVVNSGGAKNTKIAFEIQKQLMDVLNVSLDIDVVPIAKKDELSKKGKADMFRSGWVADYPSPESFLWVLYGKNVPESLDEISWPNTPRYVNPEYDELFEKAVAATSREEAYKYFVEAENIMMEDAPVIVLYYNESYRLLQANVRNFYSNPLNFIDFTSVYLKERTGKITGNQ